MLLMIGPHMGLTSTYAGSIDRIAVGGSIGLKFHHIGHNTNNHTNPPFTGDLVQLLMALLNINPNLRSSARDALQMPYFQ
jgi:hypothetical protein